MSIKITFTVDEDFTTDDLTVMLNWQQIASALYQARYRLNRIGRGKEWSDRDENTTDDQMLVYIEKMMDGLMEDLPDLSRY